MLYCKKCQIEYDGEVRFCPQCGSFLIRKEVIQSNAQNQEESAQEQPKEKYICPDCKIIYEKSKFCIRCSTGVVPLSSFQTREKEDTVSKPPSEKGSSSVLTTSEWVESSPEPLICPACKKEHLGGKTCIRCGTPLVSSDPPAKGEKTKKPTPPAPKTPRPKSPSITEFEAEIFEDETSALPAPRMSVQEQIRKGRWARKIKKDYPKLILNWSGIAIICTAIGYFLWSTYSHIATQNLASPPPTLLKDQTSSPVPASLANPTSGSSIPESEEIEKIKDLLENIKRANLSKDIDLFISSYSKDFKDREGKKRATLESWESFNFIDLTYVLGTLSFSGNHARTRVEWLVKFSPKGGGQPQESKTQLNVVFKKEDGNWKISEIR